MKRKIDSLRKRLISKARDEIREKYAGKDSSVIRAVNVLDDLDSVINLLAENVKEWYGFYFPELEKIARENEIYLKLVAELGEREKFTKDGIVEIYSNAEAAEKIADAVKTTMGSDIEKDDLKEIQLIALNAVNIAEERKFLQKYIEAGMKQVAPNFSQLCGAVLGARLLAKLGSMKRLAIVPASTIQILGAEKALFASKKEKRNGPKYGLLYQHSMVKQAGRDVKGRMARAVAGKLSIAARADYFGKETAAGTAKENIAVSGKENTAQGKEKIADRLQKELDERLKQLQK